MTWLRACLLALPLAGATVATTGCKDKLGEPCRCGDDCRSNACASGNRVLNGGACFNFQEVGECVRGNAQNGSGDGDIDPYCPMPMPMAETGMFDDGGEAGTDDGGVNLDDVPPFDGVRCDVGAGAAP